MKADFHCHSSCSDGQLSPQAVLNKAIDLELEALAITDHDSIAAYQHLAQVDAYDKQGSLQLYSGVELSCRWASTDIHVVGLGFDLAHPELLALLDEQAKKREHRAVLIARKLEKKGAKNVLEGARAHARGAALSRPHFAQVLIDQGMLSTQKQAFDRYLAQGKPCYQATDWPDIAEAVNLIKRAQGIAVLAHPTRYKMTASKLRRLVSYFAESGGQALEFVGGSATKDKQAFLKSLCQQHQLMASPASDFHSEQQPWQQLGRTGDLPKTIVPVWTQLIPLN